MFDLNYTMNNLNLHIQAPQHMFCTCQIEEDEMLTNQEGTLQAAPSKMCVLNCEHIKKQPMTICAYAALHTGLCSCLDSSNAF